MLEFVSDFGKPTAPLPAAIVACVPKNVHVEGKGETEFTISPSEITAAIEAGLKEPIMAEPEVSFLSLLLTLTAWLHVNNLQLEKIFGLIYILFISVQLEVPKELISSSQLQDLWLERRPSFIPLSPETNVTKIHDKETGITQCRLSNGIPVNYKV